MKAFRIPTVTLGVLIRSVSIVGLIVLIVVYVHFQARNFIQGPTITLTGDYTPLQHERRVTLSGTVHNIVKVTLNGKEIHTNEDGAFSQDLILENGYSLMSLEASDRFGRTTSLTREYVYVPEST